MKKFAFLFSLVMLLAIGSMAQYVRPVTLTLSGHDTIKNGAAKSYTQTLKDGYYWSVQVYYDKLTGSGDTCTWVLKESVDGIHYSAVVGAPTATFTADGTYVWSGGTGSLPLVWSSPYLKVDESYKTTCTNTARPYVYLHLKPK